MLAHDRPLVHGRGALGSPHGHTPSFAANLGPCEETSSTAPREHAPAGGREGEVYRPSYAARALVWARWARGAPWFGRCSRGAAQLEARRGEHLDYAQPSVTVQLRLRPRRGRGIKRGTLRATGVHETSLTSQLSRRQAGRCGLRAAAAASFSPECGESARRDVLPQPETL